MTPTPEGHEALAAIIGRSLERVGVFDWRAHLDEVRIAAIAVLGAGFRRWAWISCEERMPDYEDHALVYLDNGQMFSDIVDKDTGEFLGIGTDQNPLGNFATHWMPLPDSPAAQPGEGSIDCNPDGSPYRGYCDGIPKRAQPGEGEA
jgi:hypothetical protein